MLFNTAVRQHSVSVDNPSAFRIFTDVLYKMISNAIIDGYKAVVFICIGTDRSTGDSLGPLIGYKINGMRYRNIHVYGTLDNPVHAKNLEEVTARIASMHKKPFIVAIDACLGKMEHVGYINIGEGPIKPGSGVNKNLAPVGDAYITGIVNFGGFMDFLVLQNTRLSLVMKMADTISMGIKYVLWKIHSDPAVAASFSVPE
ncbi:MAG: spore protease YyaC [Clostridiales bacterium]|jgi:putative sporulation protein YyaC|nr:spore protease YyaC [Eubacteriales bacterium]MDH7567556.1 spore protease YyaC [Clostridiales bacterium]